MTGCLESLPALEAAVAERFEIFDIPNTDCPFHVSIGVTRVADETEREWLPRAARPDQGRTVSGAGLSRQEARMRCHGEAAELLSSCAWGNESLILASASELGDQAIPVDDLFGFGETQYETRREWNAVHGSSAWIPRRLQASDLISWVEARSVASNSKKYVPADFAFVGGTSAEGWETIYPGDSNGCAASSTVSEAIAGGFLELVERDATAHWWYGRQPRPGLHLQDIVADRELLVWLRRRRRKTRLLDLTSDLKVPVVAAVSAEADGTIVAVGFAAAFEPARGALSALSEMYRMECSLEIATRAQPQLRDRAFAAWIGGVNLKTFDHLQPASGNSSTLNRTFSGKALDICSGICGRNGFDLYYLDLTRPAVAIPTARAIVPGLSHLKPRFGAKLLPRHSHLASIIERLRNGDFESLVIL